MLSPLSHVELTLFSQIQHALYKGRRQYAVSLIENAPQNVRLAVEYIRPEKKKERIMNDSRIQFIQQKAQQFIARNLITGSVVREFQSLINERIEFGWVTEDDVSETAMEFYNQFWKENPDLEENEEEV